MGQYPNPLQLSNHHSPQATTLFQNQPMPSSTSPNSTHRTTKSNHPRTITLFITYGVLIYAFLALTSVASSDMFKLANAASLADDGLEDSQWRSIDYNGEQVNVDTLSRGRRILTEELILEHSHKCPDCLDYSKIMGELDVSPRIAESYVMMKVFEATKTKLDGKEEAQFAAMENFAEKTLKMPWLKEKLEEILAMNRTFGDSLNKAIAAEKNVIQLRGRYEAKVREIVDWKKKAIKNVEETGELTAKISLYERKRKEAEDEMDRRTRALLNEKKEVQGRIDLMKEKIKENLGKANAESLAELHDNIMKAQDKIGVQEHMKEACERKIESHTEQITHLNIWHTEAHRSLGDIDLQLSQWHWLNHMLETIKKFQSIREQMQDLQKTQLKDGKINIDRLIANLIEKEQNFRDNVLGKTHTVSEDERIIVNDDGSVTTVKSTYLSESSKLDNLKDLIGKERKFLKTWSREQFKTLNLSIYEIRNLTKTINNLEDQVEKAGEYDKFSQMKNFLEQNITTIMTKITELEKGLRDCELTIGVSSKTILDLRRELEFLEGIRDAIKNLETQIIIEERKLQDKDNALRRERQDISAKRAQIDGDIRTAQLNIRDLHTSLRHYVDSINDRIRDNPKLKEVQDRIADYRLKVRNSNEEYRKLLRLLEEIKRTIC